MQFKKQKVEKEVSLLVSAWLNSCYYNQDILEHVTLSGVVVANDLSYIKLYVHWQNKSLTKSLLKSLDKVNYQIRKLIVEKVNFKRAPVIKFYYDDKKDEVDNLFKVMSGIKAAEIVK